MITITETVEELVRYSPLLEEGISKNIIWEDGAKSGLTTLFRNTYSCYQFAKNKLQEKEGFYSSLNPHSIFEAAYDLNPEEIHFWKDFSPILQACRFDTRELFQAIDTFIVNRICKEIFQPKKTDEENKHQEMILQKCSKELEKFQALSYALIRFCDDYDIRDISTIFD